MEEQREKLRQLTFKIVEKPISQHAQETFVQQMTIINKAIEEYITKNKDQYQYQKTEIFFALPTEITVLVCDELDTQGWWCHKGPVVPSDGKILYRLIRAPLK